MCFRPPTTQKPIKCGECGAINPANLKVCTKCQTKLEKEENI